MYTIETEIAVIFDNIPTSYIYVVDRIYLSSYSYSLKIILTPGVNGFILHLVLPFIC